MEVLYQHCCGLDVHKQTLTACVVWRDESTQRQQAVREFPTHTEGLRQLAKWLKERGVQQVAMESTGEYWRPVWNLLEAEGFSQTLANAYHIQAVPGRKTDIKDAEWIAALNEHGLVPASFVPSERVRHLRDLTRMRTKVVQDHTRVVNRIQAVLEDANLKLAGVATDLCGVSAQAMLKGLLEGGQTPQQLAQLAQGRMRSKHDQLCLALDGRLTDHHRFLLRRLLLQAGFLDSQERMLSREIKRRLTAEEREAVRLWDTIPGVDQTTAWVLVAEIGTHSEQFPDARHLASWAALCPGNHQSAGKRKSGRTRKGNRWLRGALSQAAWAAKHSKGTYLSALFRRVAARRGRKRATIALAHSILISAYHMWKHKQAYVELGDDYLDRLNATRTVRNLSKRLKKLGFRVQQIPA